MIVVGAQALETYWRGDPAAEGPLRALHALMVRMSASDAERLLAGAERLEHGSLILRLRGRQVRLRVNADIGLVHIEGVEKTR